MKPANVRTALTNVNVLVVSGGVVFGGVGGMSDGMHWLMALVNVLINCWCLQPAVLNLYGVKGLSLHRNHPCLSPTNPQP